ncbi:ATP-dependent DNA helicase RecG [Liquorilactobacillus satsumensis]|uniref:ATP-dependent DNA helicase RecG n=1 Tax=Liquorilactobacillus satsumensis TaxID=259059 RepID=UPI0021C3502C|nr:ATP-dependent DNA helicase RecG [Liquorilactobacillus satsumensis]MCP9311828.1 ATP-dependent DNA helicase RecG [Liquorilactobacillus satsumensis]MCP9358961.1 ATP-dependent DNA helicase RecG [Liquorilactobacillus satsumensis]
MKKLDDPVSVLPGVGPKKVVALNKLNINTIEDLLNAFPFRYEDFAARKLAEVNDQEKVALKGTVASEPVVSRFGRNKNRLNFRFLIEHEVIMVTFFNQAYLAKQIETGKEMAIYGKWDAKKQRLMGIKILAAAAEDELGGVYRSSKEIKQSQVKKLVAEAFQAYHELLVDLIPLALRKKYRLMSRVEMVRNIHFPDNATTAKLARRTGIFEEFFLFQVKVQYLKKHNRVADGIKLDYDLSKLKVLIAQLPFTLTAAQKRVVNEICADLHHDYHMNRLLQGDVGSGKTIVAAIALYAAVTAGFQAALMVPTEILAQQHAEKFAHLFKDLDVNLALLTSATLGRASQRKELLKNLANGQVDLVVGTHALIQDDVNFKKLGLVVTDEQHRFGVSQRQILRQKGHAPDVLMMTATPIPRTLALTTYGEMDVSTIDELPAGRKAIETIWLKNKQQEQAYAFIEKQLDNGAQVYIVSPLIAESEMMDLKNAEEVYLKAKKRLEPQYHVGLLHGKMKGEEKEQVMRAFKAQQLHVLVATTVIEVGVDVPNATVMMILDADRFGLAQLHQLRGRVGRGTQQSYCLLLADPKNEYGSARMKVMTQTNDGFVIAQKDLELRGQGDVLGSKQAGVPDFKLGDPVANLNVLQVAQKEAAQIVKDPMFTTGNQSELYRYVRRSLVTGMSFD